MKKIFTLLFIGSLYGVEILEEDKVPKNCEKLAVVKLGNPSQTYSRDLVEKFLKEEVQKLGGNKMTLSLKSQTHTKLGVRYWGSAVAYRCP